MNYLAHFHLSGDSEGMIAGALLGDFIKGPLTDARIKQLALPDEIIKGIKLHRKIDAYVDELPALASLGRQLPEGSRRYKGIFLDLFCDYALIHHWQEIDARPLTDYTAQVLQQLARQQQHLNSDARRLFQRMVQYDLLNNYARRETIDSIIARIAHRLDRSAIFQNATHHMWQLETQWLGQFVTIYRDIQAFADRQHKAL